MHVSAQVKKAGEDSTELERRAVSGNRALLELLVRKKSILRERTLAEDGAAVFRKLVGVKQHLQKDARKRVQKEGMHCIIAGLHKPTARTHVHTHTHSKSQEECADAYLRRGLQRSLLVQNMLVLKARVFEKVVPRVGGQ